MKLRGLLASWVTLALLLCAAVLSSRPPTAAALLTPAKIGVFSYDQYDIGHGIRAGRFHREDDGRGSLRYVYARQEAILDRYGNPHEVTVEQDRLMYEFDRYGNLLSKTERWSDLPEFPRLEVTQQQAESIARQEFQNGIRASEHVYLRSNLDGFITPYRTGPGASNLLWVVYPETDGWMFSVLIDAVTSDIVGYRFPDRGKD